MTYTFVSPVVINDATSYSSIKSALNAVGVNTKTVKVRDQASTENVIMTNTGTVLFEGGYTDTGFTTQSASSYSKISGSLKIRNGTFRADHLKVK